jgi:hypothetical protein
MRQATNLQARELAVRWTTGAAIAAWVAYTFHGSINGQGLVGWVADESIRRFGSSSENTQLLIAMAIGVLPITLVSRLVARVLGVSLAPRRGVLPTGTPAQIRWRGVLAGVGILAVTGGVITMLVQPASGAAAGLDLDAAATAEPAGASRITVIGHAQPRLAAGYTTTVESSSTTTIHRFIPLTAQGWTPQAPVRFLLAEIEGKDTPRHGIVAIPERDGRTRFEGRLRRNGLATIARSALQEQGVRLADPYWVIENDNQQTFQLVVMIGGIGLALGLAMVIVGVRSGRMVARAAARRPPPLPPGARAA